MSNSVRTGGPTVTSQARRQQIVDAAISTIADVGLTDASFAKIAQRAGLSSTGLISYHFAGRADLIAAVVARVVDDGQAYMLPRIEAAAAGADRLRAYITSNLDFMADRPDDILAVASILGATRSTSGERAAPYAPFHSAGVEQLAGYLREGQRTGAFRRFDVAVMATAIRASIDQAAYRCRADSDFDAIHYGRELADMFVRAAIIG